MINFSFTFFELLNFYPIVLFDSPHSVSDLMFHSLSTWTSEIIYIYI